MEDATGIFVSFCCWVTFYVFVAQLPLPYASKIKLSKKDDLDVRNRFVAFHHGLILTIVAAYEFYFQRGACGDPNTRYEKNLIHLSVGYFFYDFSAMAYYGLLDWAMTFHHWLCIIGMSLPLTYGMSANYVLWGMFVAEASNSFMHIRAILKFYGKRYTKAYEFSEIAFLLIYMYGRLILGSYVTVSTCRCNQNAIVIKICASGLLFQSLYFIK